MKRLTVVALLFAVLATFYEPRGAGAQGDLEPPSLLISHPARGAYLSSAEVLVEGRVSDAGSGVATLLVNGAPVTPDAVTGGFSAKVPLAFGLNLVIVEAVDGAGNAAHFAGTAMSSSAYVPAGESVPGAAVTRVTERALQTIGDRTVPLIRQFADASLAGQTLFRGEEKVFGQCVASATVVAESVTFDPPQLVIDAVPTGLQTRLQIANVRIPVSARSHCGVSYSTSGAIKADAVVLDAGLALFIAPSRALDVSVTSSAVSLQGFDVGISGVPSAIERRVRSAVRDAVEARLADAIRTAIPGAIRPALARLSVPVTRESNGRTVTLAAMPTAVTFDDRGFTVVFAGSLSADVDPAAPAAPGSIVRPTEGLPAYSDTAGFYTSLNENLINRALFGSWQAGFWDVTIDEAFLERLGVSLPFPLDASLLTGFFPALRPVIAGRPAPLVVKLEPKLQPVARVSDGPGILTLGLGEFDVIALADLGEGFVPLLTVATYVEVPIDAVFVGDTVSFTVLWPGRLAADLIAAPVPIADADVDRFLQFAFPALIQLVTGSIGPMPVPAFPGFGWSHLRLYPDGPAREFVTLEADVR
jgi:hypothetical protein